MTTSPGMKDVEIRGVVDGLAIDITHHYYTLLYNLLV